MPNSDENNRVAVGRRIRITRKTKDITGKQLAKDTGLSAGYLSEVERGLSSISVEKLRPIAKELGVSMQFLLEGTTDEVALTDEVRIPAALAEAAEELDLSYAVTVRLLEGRRSLVARRSTSNGKDWSAAEWMEFYEKVRDYI